MEIAVQLRKPPSEENKFLHESDRQEVVTQANTYLLGATKNLIKTANLEAERRSPKAILEIHKVYVKLQKLWPGKEKELAPYLKDFYAQVKMREDKDKVTIEEALRFCVAETTRQRLAMNNKQTTSSSTASATMLTISPTSATGSAGGGAAAAKQASSPSGFQQQQQNNAAALMAQYGQLSQLLADQQVVASAVAGPYSISNVTHS